MYVVYGSIPHEPVVVFDVDGVLVDCSERLSKSLEEVGARDVRELRGEQRRRFWEVFLSGKYVHLDKPNQVAVELIKRLGASYPIVIISGRPAKMAEVTIKQLRELGVPFTAVVFRADNYFGKDHEYKELVVRELGIKMVEAHDDSEEVCRVYSKYTSRVFLWKNLAPVQLAHNYELAKI